MNALIKILLELFKKMGPQLISALFSAILGGSKSSPSSTIERASEISSDRIEWIEKVKEAGANGDGKHPLDRLLNDAVKAEETKAKMTRGLRGAADISLRIAKRIILP